MSRTAIVPTPVSLRRALTTSRSRVWAIAAIAAALLSAPRTADADAGARVLIVVNESLEGRATGSRGAEPELAKKFLAEGYQVVERFESEGVHSRVPLERILEGKVQGNEVSEINADILVVGRVALTPEALPYGLKGKAYEASMEVRVLLTDSGRVVYSGQTSLTRKGSTAKVSGIVAGSLADKLLPQVKKALASREVIELRVSGLKSASHADKLAAKLAADRRITGAKVRYVSADITVIDLRAKGVSVEDLSATMTGAGLEITRRSSNVVSARYDALAASRRSIVVAAFENRTRNKAHDWIEDVGPDMFETEVDNSRYLSAKVLNKRAGAKTKAALAAARTARADLVVTAYFQAVGNKLRLSASVHRVKDRRVIARAQVVGDDADAVETVSKLVWKLDQALYKKLNPKGSLAGYETKVRKYAPRGAVLTGAGTVAVGAQAAPPKAGRVVISDSTLQPVFPAQLAHYANKPFGEVVLTNIGKTTTEAVRLGVKVEGLMDDEHRILVEDIPAGGQVRVPITAIFDRKKLIATTQRRPVRVDVRVAYEAAGKSGTDSVTTSTVLHDRNAMNWQEDRAIAAFITYRDPYVDEFARKALAAAGKRPRSMPVGLFGAVALFDAIQDSGMTYRRDPVAAYGKQAVDAVYFPRDTLHRQVGDCDDLAVLYASLLAASGRNARIVYTPGHVFVAVDTELSLRQAKTLGGAGRVLAIDGRAWVPVEVTRLGRGFVEAWNEGIAEIGRYRTDSSQITYVDFRADWLSYPPFPLPAHTGVPPRPTGQLAQLVAKDVSRIGKGQYGKPVAKGLPQVTGTDAASHSDQAKSNPWGLMRAGAAAAREGNYTDAVSAFKAAKDIDHTRAAAFNNLGNTYALLERWPDAIAAYKQASADRAIRGTVLTNLGYAEFNAGNGAEAKRVLKQAKTRQAKRLLRKLGLVKARKPRKPRTPTGASPRGTAAADVEYGMRAGGRVEPSQVLIWIEGR